MRSVRRCDCLGCDPRCRPPRESAWHLGDPKPVLPKIVEASPDPARRRGRPSREDGTCTPTGSRGRNRPVPRQAACCRLRSESGGAGTSRTESLELRVDGQALRRVRRLRGDCLESLRLPEDGGDVVRRLEQVLGRLEANLLTRLRTGLERLPHEIVKFRERLQVLGLEVVAPEDPNLVLRNL